MTKELRRVEIASVDRDAIEKDNAFPKAYAFYINLFDKPESLWSGLLKTNLSTPFTLWKGRQKLSEINYA